MPLLNCLDFLNHKNILYEEKNMLRDIHRRNLVSKGCGKLHVLMLILYVEICFIVVWSMDG